MLLPELPHLGLGAGLSPDQVPALLNLTGGRFPADYVELFSEDPTVLAEAVALLPPGTPAVLHGNALSPAGADGIPAELLSETREAADLLRAPWILEDLAVWRLDGVRPVGSPFWPPVFDTDLLDLLASRLGPLERCLGRPFLCEVAPLDVYVGETDLPDFFAALTRRTGCGLVLDVSHWLRYAQLFDVNPRLLWNRFPLDHALELHVSGGRRVPGPRWYDEEHSASLLPECLELLEAALAGAPSARAVTVESHGAPPEVVLESLDAAAARPGVAALRARARAALHTAGRPGLAGPAPPPAGGDVEFLAEPGGARLRRRQRTMRRLLEQPRDLAAIDDPDSPLAGEDRCLFTCCPRPLWEEASRRRLGKLGGLPPIAAEVLRSAWGDLGIAYSKYAASCDGLPSGPVEPLQLLDLFADEEALPDWARDSLVFERDVLLVAAGDQPRSASVPRREGSGFLVSYRRPVIGTVQAIQTGAPRPPAAPHLVEMVIAAGLLSVRDAGPGTLP